VIRLNAAHGDERVRAIGDRLGYDHGELSDLVATEAKRDGVVSLGENPLTRAEGGTKPREILDG
jgi:hypothetical protein